MSNLSPRDRLRVAEWIGERPETVLAVHGLLSGHGRVWLHGTPASPVAALVASRLVPAEPQGFGDADALIDLLVVADRWECVEVDPALAEAIAGDIDRRWGLRRRVIDVVHKLDEPAKLRRHPLVRQLSPAEARDLPPASRDLLPNRQLLVAAAELGRGFAAIDDGLIVGHGSSLAAGRSFADVGVHVAGRYRRQGIATAAASMACHSVQADGLTPVWGTGSHNAASLRVAAKLRFIETARLVYLVRGDV